MSFTPLPYELVEELRLRLHIWEPTPEQMLAYKDNPNAKSVVQ